LQDTNTAIKNVHYIEQNILTSIHKVLHKLLSYQLEIIIEVIGQTDTKFISEPYESKDNNVARNTWL